MENTFEKSLNLSKIIKHGQSINESEEISLIDKCEPIFDNKNSDLSNFENILKNEKLMNIINDPEINEENMQKEIKRIDKDYDNDLQNINLLEEFSTNLLKNLDDQNETKLQNLQLEESKENKTYPINGRNEIKNLEEKNVLNMDIILKSIYLYEKNNPKFQEKLDKEQEKEILINLTNLLLNDKKISKIKNLDIFDKLEELYLQRNFIVKIDGFSHLKNLTVLNLNNNFIKKIENLTHLKNLKILDIADNIIQNFEINEIPKNINYLYLYDNLFYDVIDFYEFRYKCLITFPDLIRLDCLNINDIERSYLLNFKINKKDSLTNKNLKKKLKHISDHYKEIKNERKNVLDQYMNFLKDGYENLNLEYNISQSTIKFSDRQGNENINEHSSIDLSHQTFNVTDNSEMNEILSTKQSNLKSNKKDFKLFTKEIIDEENNLVNQEFLNSDQQLGINSSDLVGQIKLRAKNRQFEFKKDFYLTSKQVKENLEDIKIKFNQFKDQFHNLQNSDLESKIKERINFDQRISKVDEKLKDIDIFSKNLGEKLNEIRSKIQNEEEMLFYI